MKIFTLLALLSGLALLYTTDPGEAFTQEVTLETFETDAILTFPRRWSAFKDAQVAQTIYQVTEEGGNRFLRAYS